MKNLFSLFLTSAQAHPDRIALKIRDREYSYAELLRRAGGIASALDDGAPVAGVFAERSIDAYAGILGTLGSGKGYVPLNPRFPLTRTKTMIELSGCRTLVVGQECLDQLDELLGLLHFTPTVVIWRDEERPGDDARAVNAAELAQSGTFPVTQAEPDDTAYVMFTSGTTGVPKGVAVSQQNAVAYFDYINNRYGFTPDDRFTQLFDLTFDLSVHDLFTSWGSGGRLCVVPHEELFIPARFINKNEITVWFSVPSTAIFMGKMKLLKPGALPSLRISLFCGEPLHATTAEKWSVAACNSIIENLYGPTEATIAFTHYRWTPDDGQYHLGMVPIGVPFTTQHCAVVDGQFHRVAPGESGELVLGGSQVTAGYINNPEKTKESFVEPSDLGPGRWYRTGDLVQFGTDGNIRYKGRVDHQIKIRGYRVELAEIENVLREATGQDLAIAVPGINSEGLVDRVVGVSLHSTVPKPEILAFCKERLPNYMVPSEVIFLETFPMNANGKVDRGALQNIIKERQ
jgi:amino acid adenylation domain-containing protein